MPVPSSFMAHTSRLHPVGMQVVRAPAIFPFAPGKAACANPASAKTAARTASNAIRLNTAADASRHEQSLRRKQGVVGGRVGVPIRAAVTEIEALHLPVRASLLLDCAR